MNLWFNRIKIYQIGLWENVEIGRRKYQQSYSYQEQSIWVEMMLKVMVIHVSEDENLFELCAVAYVVTQQPSEIKWNQLQANQDCQSSS